MVQSAAKHFSPPIVYYTPLADTLPEAHRPFPSPTAFASPSVVPILRSLGFGYRAPFIQRTAEMLVNEHPDNPECVPHAGFLQFHSL